MLIRNRGSQRNLVDEWGGGFYLLFPHFGYRPWHPPHISLEPFTLRKACLLPGGSNPQGWTQISQNQAHRYSGVQLITQTRVDGCTRTGEIRPPPGPGSLSAASEMVTDSRTTEKLSVTIQAPAHCERNGGHCPSRPRSLLPVLFFSEQSGTMSTAVAQPLF